MTRRRNYISTEFKTKNMGDLQATIEFSVELYKFFNVDLFQRGLYQVRCALRVSPRLPVQVETKITGSNNPTNSIANDNSCVSAGVNNPGSNGVCGDVGGGGMNISTASMNDADHKSDSKSESFDSAINNGLPGGTACIINGFGASRVFQILYRNEEVNLRDIIQFRAHLLVDSRHLKESIERAEFSLLLELWFGEQNGSVTNLSLVSTRTLQLNFHPGRGLHYHLPVLFDYFHLAAISVGIHASLVALHQPYINAPKSYKPWISGGKLSCRGSMSPGPLEAVFFGPQVSGITKCSGGPAGRLLQSRTIHREVCSLLLGAIENLKATLNEFSTIVPPSVNAQIGNPPFCENDTNERLKLLTDQAKLHDSEEDFAIRANSDIAQLCAESTIHWRRVLVASTQSSVHKLLSKKHHILRVRRFAEGFFVVENPRHSASGCYDGNYQNYVAIAEMARRSRYLQSLPPLPVHCSPIDGDTSSLPLIFEDRYIEPPSYTRQGIDSDPHLIGQITSTTNNCHKSLNTHNKSIHLDKTHSVNSLNGANGTTSDECYCNGSSNNYQNQNFRGDCELPPRFALGGDILQASFTISPTENFKSNATVNASTSQLHMSRHSVTGLLEDGYYESTGHYPGNMYSATDNNGTLPARHSKSLDQLDGTVLSRLSFRNKGHGHTLKFREEYQRHSEIPSASRIHFNSYHCTDNTKEKQNDKFLKNIRFHKKCTNFDEAMHVDTVPMKITEVDSEKLDSGMRSGKFDYLKEIKLLNQPKQSAGKKIGNYNSLPKCTSSISRVAPRNSYPPINIQKPNGLVDNCPETTMASSKPDVNNLRQCTLPRSNSSRSLIQNVYIQTELKSSKIPRSVEIARVRVSDLKEMLKNGKLPKESSSSESDIPAKVRKSKTGQKMLSSASVPFKFDDYNTISGTDQSINGFSESLPNLAPPLPEFGTDNRLFKNKIFPNDSTSSLSEESGWVSSHRSSLGLSSPETITNEDKHRQQITSLVCSSMETKLNGEQLCLKLQKLLEQQHTNKIKHKPRIAANFAKRAPLLTNRIVTPNQKKPSSITIQMQAEHQKCEINLRRLHIRRLQNDETTEFEEMEKPERHRGEYYKQIMAEKSKSDSDLSSTKDLQLIENLRVPPPQQFQDDLLPPDEFRDPPSTVVVNGTKQPALSKDVIKNTNNNTDTKINTNQTLISGMNISLSISPNKEITDSQVKIQCVDIAQSPANEMLHKMPKQYTSLQQQPIRAIDNPVYHIYESLKPIASPALFSTKPILKTHSIVELKRSEDFLNYYYQNKKTSSNKIGIGSTEVVFSNNVAHTNYELCQTNGLKEWNCIEDEDKENTNSIPTIPESQKSSIPHTKTKRKGHEPSISFMEFENYREEFRKQIKYTGAIYSDFVKLASELPYFYISDECRAFSANGMHLVICVHGLDGNSADLRLVRTYLELGLPGVNLEFLMSERNQGDTFSDFETMTDRLVGEILYHIENCGLNPTRISFVAHSLGTIIVRSALARPALRPLLPRLHTFLSLSGPHLGTLYNSSGLVNMGMWFMQKWKKSGSLLQLCMRDTTDLRNTFLYRLSQRSTLHHFKNILLCGSSQDRYVPPHSARLELCKQAMRDNSNLGSVYREMVHNIITPILARPKLTLVRFDVHHALPNTANTLIGRAAHIAVLDSELFIEKFFLIVALKYFS